MAECKTCHRHGYTEKELAAHTATKCEPRKHSDDADCEFED